MKLTSHSALVLAIVNVIAAGFLFELSHIGIAVSLCVLFVVFIITFFVLSDQENSTELERLKVRNKDLEEWGKCQKKSAELAEMRLDEERKLSSELKEQLRAVESRRKRK